MILILISWCANFNVYNIDRESYTKEFFNGIRQCPQNKVTHDDDSENNEMVNSRVPTRIKIARLYTLLFLFRRFMIICIIILMDDFAYGFKISILILIQFLYLCYIIFSRCFQKVSDQLCEIINEAIYLIAVISLAHLTTANEWSKTAENAFIGLILMNAIVLLLVALITAISNIIKSVVN